MSLVKIENQHSLQIDLLVIYSIWLIIEA